MSEGYFPDGEPEDRKTMGREKVQERIAELEAMEATVDEDDYLRLYLIVSELSELAPESISLKLAKGSLLETLVNTTDDDLTKEDYNYNAKRCYEEVLEEEPFNVTAKLLLGLLQLHYYNRPDLAHPLLKAASDEFIEYADLATQGVLDCEFLNGLVDIANTVPDLQKVRP